MPPGYSYPIFQQYPLAVTSRWSNSPCHDNAHRQSRIHDFIGIGTSVTVTPQSYSIIFSDGSPARFLGPTSSSVLHARIIAHIHDGERNFIVDLSFRPIAPPAATHQRPNRCTAPPVTFHGIACRGITQSNSACPRTQPPHHPTPLQIRRVIAHSTFVSDTIMESQSARQNTNTFVSVLS